MRSPHSSRPIDFSLFYFSADQGEDPADKYRLLVEGAKFADQHGFAAVWTPERHFHEFGGLYPNPSVTSAAIAMITKNIQIRSGSVVAPLHTPIRIAEEWSVVDNLSNGRVAISFASGWMPEDFVIKPENYASRRDAMLRSIEIVRSLWRGETVAFPGPLGPDVRVRILPRPIQAELPIWVTTAGNPETYEMAGNVGANVLTHLLGQSLDEVAKKVAIYRKAWSAAAHPGRGKVTLMLRPESIAVVAPEAAALAGRLESVTFVGDRQRMVVTEAAARPLLVDAPNTVLAAPGDRVGLRVDLARIRILPEEST